MATLIDSNERRLTLQDVIKIAAQNTKSEYSFHQVYLSIMKELTMADSIVIQIGNTVFLTHRSKQSPRYAWMRALNADTAQNYMVSAEKYAKMIYDKYGIDVIVSDYEDPALNNIFAYVGRNKPQNMGFNITKGPNGKGFRATAKLGPPRGAFQPQEAQQQQPMQPQGNI